jgi:carbon-monoxide dehydrogenase iron sulfur subunit
MAKMLMISADKCTGCRNCELACSMHHEGAFRPDATRVHVYSWEREGF